MYTLLSLSENTCIIVVKIVLLGLEYTSICGWLFTLCVFYSFIYYRVYLPRLIPRERNSDVLDIPLVCIGYGRYLKQCEICTGAQVGVCVNIIHSAQRIRLRWLAIFWIYLYLSRFTLAWVLSVPQTISSKLCRNYRKIWSVKILWDKRLFKLAKKLCVYSERWKRFHLLEFVLQ